MIKAKSLPIVLISIFSFAAPPSVDAGSIVGKVQLLGAPPKLGPVKVTKDHDYCGYALPDETYITGPNGGLKNAVVFIEQSPSAPPPPLREHILDNDGCRFVPHVMAIIRGEKLIIKNSDPKLHIVHSYLDQRTVFNLSLPFPNQRIEVSQRIRTAGLLHVKCDTMPGCRATFTFLTIPFLR